MKKTTKINKSYTHFAVHKSSGKIVDGWEYSSQLDKDDIKYYYDIDMKDNDRDLKKFKCVDALTLFKSGVNPYDSQNWVNDSELMPEQEEVVKEEVVKVPARGLASKLMELLISKGLLASELSISTYKDFDKDFNMSYNRIKINVNRAYPGAWFVGEVGYDSVEDSWFATYNLMDGQRIDSEFANISELVDWAIDTCANKPYKYTPVVDATFRFRSPINIDHGSSGAVENISKDAESEIQVSVDAQGGGFFEWVIEELSLVESGYLQFEGNVLEDYDGVFELPRQLIDFLTYRGFDMSHAIS